MAPNSWSNHGRDLVGRNKLLQAIKFLQEQPEIRTRRSVVDSLTAIRRQLAAIQQQEILGIVDLTTSLREQSIIARAILDTIRRVEQGEVDDDPVGSDEDGETRTNPVILFLASNPEDTGKLQLEKEFINIHTKLQEASWEYILKVHFSTTLDVLTKTFKQYRPSFIHFSGHGIESDEDANIAGGLLVHDERGESQLIPTAALKYLFKKQSERFKIKLVVLNACYGWEQAEAISEYVPYVVGVSEQLSDEIALAFSRAFYLSLSASDSLGEKEIIEAYEDSIFTLLTKAPDQADALKLFVNGKKTN